MTTRRKRNDYKTDLLADLRDRDYAKGYLSAAAKESFETFLLALRDVAEAQKGMAKVAREAKVNRENLYRMLSEEGNPRLSSLYAVLDALGFAIDIGVKETARTSSEAAP
jgi:probable addiction module antidote protein